MTNIDRRERWFAAALVAAGALLLFAAYLAASPQRTSAQGPEFGITLYGGNEVPPVFTEGTGSITLQMVGQTLNYHLVASGAEFTQAHLHLGPAGENGGVVAFLLQPQDPPITSVDVSGTVTPDDLIGPLEGNWAGFAAAFISDGLYVNIHSTANPGGDLRAQVNPQYCATNLSGENETDPNDSDAQGDAFFDASTGGIGYSLVASGGTQAFTMGHIHTGLPGEDGPVAAWLFPPEGPPPADPGVESISVTGQILPEDVLEPVEGDLVALLSTIAQGGAYVNVHSEEFPAGEIRAQIAHCSNTDNPAPDVETPTPTPTLTEEPTETAEPTETPTAAPTNTPTTAPTATATPTATEEAPEPPDTGTGTQSGESTLPLAFLMLGIAAIAAGGIVIAHSRRS